MKYLLFLFLTMCMSAMLLAQEIELQDIRISGDVDARLPFNGGGNVIASDDAIFVVDLNTGTANAFSFVNINMDNNDVDAYHDPFYSYSNIGTFDGVVVYPNDVFSLFGGTKIIDGRNDGIPDGVNIDAVTVNPDNDAPVISIDIPAVISGTFFKPDDLIQFNAGNFTLFAAPETGLDIDGAHILSDGEILVSFESNGTLPDGRLMLDDDIFRWNPVSDSYTSVLFTSELDASWFGGDVDAIYAIEEPPVGVFQWTANVYEVNEASGSALVTIRRNGGSAGEVTLTFAVSDDTATGGSDYTIPAVNTVTFNDGQLFNQFGLIINNDALVEGNESFFIELTATSDGSLGSPTRARILIRDDEDFIFADGFES